MMTQFRLNRFIDESGVSGTGIVLHGVVMPSGKVAVEWRLPMPTITIYESMDQFRAIHLDRHPGCSMIEWLD